MQLEWVAENHGRDGNNGPAVVTLSLGVPLGSWSAPLEGAIRTVVSSFDITVIVASGNSRTDRCMSTSHAEPLTPYDDFSHCCVRRWYSDAVVVYMPLWPLTSCCVYAPPLPHASLFPHMVLFSCSISPAHLSEVITVGASKLVDGGSSRIPWQQQQDSSENQGGRLWEGTYTYGNYGPCIDLFAPGVNIFGACGGAGDLYAMPICYPALLLLT